MIFQNSINLRFKLLFIFEYYKPNEDSKHNPNSYFSPISLVHIH
jgi:hypothetical protein